MTDSLCWSKPCPLNSTVVLFAGLVKLAKRTWRKAEFFLYLGISALIEDRLIICWLIINSRQFFVTKMCSSVQVKFTINDEFNVILTSKPPINGTYWMECFIVVTIDIQYYLYQMTMEIPSHGHKGRTSPRLFFLPPSIGTIDSANLT